MSRSDHSEWKVEISRGGRDGYIGYWEGEHVASFYWEFGGADVVMIVHLGQPSKRRIQLAWATDRQRQIFERVAQEVIRQGAPFCTADIDEHGGYIYIREPKMGT